MLGEQDEKLHRKRLTDVRPQRRNQNCLLIFLWGNMSPIVLPQYIRGSHKNKLKKKFSYWRFKSETGSLSGTVEVTYVSLKSVYSIQDRWALRQIIIIIIMVKTFNHQNPCKKSNPCPQLQVPTCAFNNQLPLRLSRWRQPVRQVFSFYHFMIIFWSFFDYLHY